MNGILCAYLRRDRAEHADRRGDGVAAALDRELDDVLGVEVARVRREARARRVLDALVDRQDRHVAGAGQAAVVDEPLQVAQHRAACGRVSTHDAVDEVRARQVQRRAASIVSQRWFSSVVGVVAEQLLEARRRQLVRWPL